MILRFTKYGKIFSWFKIYKDVTLYYGDKAFKYDNVYGLQVFDNDNEKFNYKKYDYYFIDNISHEEIERFIAGVGYYSKGIRYLENTLYEIRKQYMAFFKVSMKPGNNMPTVSTVRRHTNPFEFALNACIFGLDWDKDMYKTAKIDKYINYIGMGRGNNNIRSSVGLLNMLDLLHISYTKLKP